MAGDSAMELLFLDTFKHQNAELTNVDVVRFPYGVLITEVRVIPPGIKAHSNLPDSRAFGETAPHAFQLDLFFNNVSKPNSPVFDRLGSLEYDENKSIIFRPNGKINTDGLVLRGWYTCLTLAVYGTAERPHSHERDSPPPPPPPPPQQQQIGSKRLIKLEWENEDQFNGSPPRPQPRGPRTPPGPPPPDDDDEEAMPAPGQCPVKVENTEHPGDDYLEPVSPERGSLPADETYSDAEQEDDEGPADEEEDDVQSEGTEGDEDDEEDEVGDDVTDEDGEGDDGYEQISSDEEDLESGAFKLPAFDLDYTPEDLASLPTVQYDPYERELRPLQHFTPPHITRYEAELKRLKTVDIEDSSSSWAESAAKLSELLEAWGEAQGAERGAGWVTALEEVPAFLVKGMSFLSIKDPDGQSEKLKQLVDWSCEALSLDVALAQPIALNLRQLKAGTKLVSALADCGAQAVQDLLEKGIVGRLLGLLFAEHVSSTLKLNVLRSLDSIISEPQGIEAMLRDRHHHDDDGTSGYQRLLDLFLLDQTVRVATAGAAILHKGHLYEVLTDLQKTASVWAERHPTVGEVAEREGSESEAGERDRESTEREGEERERETQEAERESPMDIDTLLESASLSEADLERLQGLLEELLHLLETAPHCMVQPPGKAFPTNVRITGPPERDDPYPTLYRYMHACHLLESLGVVLSYPATCAHIGVLQAVRELMRFLSQSQQGLLFLLSQHETINLLLRLLTPLTHLTPPSHLAPLTPLSEVEGEEAAAGGEGLMDDGFWVWLMQTLHALQGIAELNGAELEDGDNPDVLATLHSLYLISFSSTGRNAVAHTFSLDNNLSCLINLIEFHAKDGQGDGKARKSVTYNYACMLVLLVIQTSSDLRMMEHYAAPLLLVCKADENNAKLQELSKWLEPLEKLHFDISGIPMLIDYIKQNLENLMTADGVGLVTALRVLCHIACPPATVPGQQKDLKWNQAIIALFSAEGMDTFIKVLQKLTSLLLLPWRLHGPMGPTAQRLMMLSVASCSLRLIRAMLTELLCGGTCEFRDVRVPSVCVTLHKILCSTPSTGRLDAEELRIQGDVTEILLTFTHAVSEQETGSEETVAGNSWSLMLKEVLNSILAAPENIYSSLSLLSELLPLPLPMQTTQALSVQDIGVAMNTRKLWSVHLHAQARVLQEVLRCACVSSCPPLFSMLRRVCVQLCDLAAPTATLVMRTLLEQLQEEMQQEAAGSRLIRVLALLDSLASQRACKVAMLALLSGSARSDTRSEGKVEDKLSDILPSLLAMLVLPADVGLSAQQNAELMASILQSLCDQDVSLVVSGSGEASVSEAELLANALPTKEMMTSICEGMLDVLGNTHSSYTLQLTCLRTMMFLTEHDYGLYHLKSSLKKHTTAISSLIRREITSFNKEFAELLSALFDFLRQILNSEAMFLRSAFYRHHHADEDMDSRSLALSVSDMKQLLQWKEDSGEHLLCELEKHITKLCKEDESLEALLENVVGLRQIIESSGDAQTNAEPETEPSLPAPEPLQTQFNHRTVYVLSDVLDEQLKALWFSPFQPDEMETEVDMVKVDLVALAQQCCTELDLKAELERSFLSEPSSPGHSKPSKGFRLGKHKHETFITSSGRSDYVEPAKRAHIMAAPRGRGRGSFGQLSRPHDIFRQRKQNTSRPPSMHVDDFLAAEFKDVGPPTGLTLPKRPPKGGGAKPPTRGMFTGGTRGRGFQSHTRFFTPPAPKSVLLAGNYPRREGGRGSTWSTPVTAVTHRGTYSEPRGGQSNFTRPLPSRQPPTGAYRLAPRDRATRGRGTGLSWLSAGVSVGGGGGVSGGGRGQGKFSSGGSGGGRGRHVRSFTR
ncbi:protein virilizer homolog isoform X2 [Danio rerio]|uniref:Protein virilizer homolog isoform X2 n=1 Tax=Danio rerio TaxID=7955 RepID=A0A0R4IAI1_DANRE|nr:protein virilizer homolog isoform X2 [Danio rerio]|eukprot:XP_005158092.1 protein virilizer homolog isoform X2 [Danio rerio]